jgi:hypothetical protein
MLRAGTDPRAVAYPILIYETGINRITKKENLQNLALQNFCFSLDYYTKAS